MHWNPLLPEPERPAESKPDYDPDRPWRNTSPRGNGEPDRQDLKRSLKRFEALLGR